MLGVMSGRLVSPTFVGRSQALDSAADALRQIASGRATHLLVAGEAGIGKTRYCQAVADRAVSDGFQVLNGGCVHLEAGELPYAPFGEALRGLTRRLDASRLAVAVGDDGAILARIAPSLGPEVSAVDQGDPSGAARARLLGAVLGLFGRLARDAPVLFIVEDLQWADSATLDSLAFLLRSLRDERIGLVGTIRSDELHRRHPLRPWLGEVERLGTVQRLDLGPLGPVETGELIAAIRGDDPGRELIDRVRLRSDGNPLFVEELLALENLRSDRSPLSPSLRDILLARVGSVSDGSRGMLDIAAVAGRIVDAVLLTEVSGLMPQAVDASLKECVERQIFVVDRSEARDRLAFRHALIAEAVYDGILPDERIKIHRAIAQALAARIATAALAEPGRWAELVGHWDAARDEVRAFDAAVHAADEAERAFAWAAALRQYRRVLAGWGIVPDPAAIAGFDRVELLSRAATASQLSGGRDPVGFLREAIAEVDRQGDAARGSLLRGRLGLDLWFDGQPAEAREVYREALAMVPPDPPTVERAWILARLAQVLMLQGSERESQGVAEAAIDIARAVGDRQIETHALSTLGCSLGAQGMAEQAADCLERSIAIAVELGDIDNIGRVFINATEVLAICGRDDRALELATQGMERAAALGIGEVDAALIGPQAAVINYESGRWQEAARLLEEGRVDVPTADADVSLAKWVEILAKTVELDVGTGAWEAAEAKLSWVGLRLRDGFESEYQYTGPHACARAELALWQARPLDAIAAIEEVLPRLERTDDVRYRMRLLRLGMRATADLAEVARDRRDSNAEAEALGVARALQARSAAAVSAISGMDGGLALELAAEVATVVAEEARLRGRDDPAAWREAVAGWAARGRPYHQAYARFREGEASLAAGHRSDAAEALGEAAGTATALGARPMLAAVEALARRARIPLHMTERAGPAVPPVAVGAEGARAEFGLTSRECDVLELLAQGMSNRQIADALFISVNTAGIHVSRILGKLDAASRTEAASMAYRLGLVST